MGTVTWSFNLANCMDVAAGLALVHQMAYTKGFSDGTTLREFCDEPGNTTYFPGADSRPEVWKREMRACEP